jgi:hypothetical protein
MCFCIVMSAHDKQMLRLVGDGGEAGAAAMIKVLQRQH